MGLSAGFSYTYQYTVLPAYSLLDDVTYVQTFQRVNEVVVNPWFAAIFFGPLPALTLAALTQLTSDRRGRPAAILLAISLVLYLVGFGITAAGNVGPNDTLALVTEITPETAAAARADFEDGWNRFNLFRTIAIVASFLFATVAAFVAERR